MCSCYLSSLIILMALSCNMYNGQRLLLWAFPIPRHSKPQKAAHYTWHIALWFSMSVVFPEIAMLFTKFALTWSIWAFQLILALIIHQ